MRTLKGVELFLKLIFFQNLVILQFSLKKAFLFLSRIDLLDKHCKKYKFRTRSAKNPQILFEDFFMLFD